MISVKNKEPLIYYGSKTIKEVYKGSTRIYPSVDILKIMDSLVCWYDIGKQQCTNESMAANPVLADLSGNGHDIECFNFDWSGMSGIGGYVYDLIKTIYSTVSNNIVTIISNEGAAAGTSIATPKKITGEKGKTLTYTRKAFDIKISNLPVGVDIQVGLGKNNGNTTKWESIGYFVNGVNHVDEKVITVEPYDSESTPYIMDCRILFSNELASVENIADLGITIELLPEYPNALVSDGVDDYCYTEGLPILTDYTVIANRTVIDKEKVNCIFAVKGETGTNNVNQAFAIDIVNHKGHYFYSSFGLATEDVYGFRNDDLLICTKNKINDTTITPGNTIDNFPNMNLFGYPASNRYIVAALYSFLLFDRTLTTAEIEWVKQNMIESKLLL